MSAACSEQFNPAQRHLFEEMLNADLEAIGLEIEALKHVERPTPPKGRAATSGTGG